MNKIKNDSIIPYTILSYLDYKELVKFSRVCKQWHNIQNNESIWKQLCVSYLNGCVKTKNLWKQQFRIIHRWLTGKYTKEEFDSKGNIFNHYSFTKLGLTERVESKYSDNIMFYNHCSHKIQKIRLDENIVCFYLEGEVFSALTNKGSIYRYDVSGKFINKLENKIERTNITSSIYSDKNIILTVTQKSLKVWDIKKGLIREVVEKPNKNICWLKYRFTIMSHHIIIYTNGGRVNGYRIKNWNRDLFITRNKQWEWGDIVSSEKYLALKAKKGIEVYRENSNQFKQIHFLKVPKNNKNIDVVYQAMKIYQNWLLVCANKNLYIWNLQSGEI